MSLCNVEMLGTTVPMDELYALMADQL